MSSATAAPPAPGPTQTAASGGERAEFGRQLESFRRRIDGEMAAFLAAKRRLAALAVGEGAHAGEALPEDVRQPRAAGDLQRDGGASRADARDAARHPRPAGRSSGGAGELARPEVLVDGVGGLLELGGKRLRPALVYFTYRACGGAAEGQVLPLALSTELLHSYLLIHDDIMDHAATRRGEPAAHVRFAALHRAGGLRGDGDDFGRSAALLLGDLAHTYAAELFAHSLELSARPAPADSPGAPGAPGSPLLAEMARCFAEMCEEVIAGQFAEYLLAHQPAARGAEPARGEAAQSAPQEADLLRILRLKSGRYTAERPIQLGALLAGAPAAVRAELSRYGTAVGEAFQLQDDLLGVFGDAAVTGKPVGDDLREGKYTLLVHRALLALADSGDTAADGAFLRAALGRPDLSVAEVARAQGILESTGARAAIEAMIEERLAAARAALGALTGLDGEGVRFLAGLLHYLREREE
jgi:geranylgeranyl diphosphate synthase, type I